MMAVMLAILIVKHLVRDDLNRTVGDLFIPYLITPALPSKYPISTSIPMLTSAPAAALTIDTRID